MMEFLPFALSAVATAAVGVSLYLTGKMKMVQSQLTGFIGCILWIAYGLCVKDYGIIPVNVLFMALYMKSYMAWRSLVKEAKA